MSHADEVDVEILKQLKAMDSKKEPDHELDEEGVYAQSVAATLRKLTPEQRGMAKIKIQQSCTKFSTACHRKVLILRTTIV